LSFRCAGSADLVLFRIAFSACLRSLRSAEP
jgi:hypothetical protein